MKPEVAVGSKRRNELDVAAIYRDWSIERHRGNAVLDMPHTDRLEAHVVVIVIDHGTGVAHGHVTRPPRSLGISRQLADVEMANASITADGATGSSDSSRRDFLLIATGAVGAVGAAGAAWTLISQAEPDAQTIAEGAPIDVDISAVPAGQQILVKWRGHPIFIVNRPKEALKVLQDPALTSQLADPDSKILQQPTYAENWHRSVKPELLVLVGVCTHLGCIPGFRPDKGEVDSSWLGGYFCPCHGSKYDLAGRVYRGVPAPYNLPVPPYTYVNDKTIRIGGNPTGQTFELSNVVQL